MSITDSDWDRMFDYIEELEHIGYGKEVVKLLIKIRGDYIFMEELLKEKTNENQS